MRCFAEFKDEELAYLPFRLTTGFKKIDGQWWLCMSIIPCPPSENMLNIVMVLVSSLTPTSPLKRGIVIDEFF